MVELQLIFFCFSSENATAEYCITHSCNDDGFDDENEFEGLIELFKQEIGDKVQNDDDNNDDNHDDNSDDDYNYDYEYDDDDDDDALCDIAALFDGCLGNHNNNNDGKYSCDSRGMNDGIILSSSMFIILLCLSLAAGIFIGKGDVNILIPYDFHFLITVTAIGTFQAFLYYLLRVNERINEWYIV